MSLNRGDAKCETQTLTPPVTLDTITLRLNPPQGGVSPSEAVRFRAKFWGLGLRCRVQAFIARDYIRMVYELVIKQSPTDRSRRWFPKVGLVSGRRGVGREGGGAKALNP